VRKFSGGRKGVEGENKKRIASRTHVQGIADVRKEPICLILKKGL